MRKLLITSLLFTSTSVFAYSIGGAYAELLSCEFGEYGYQWGNIGTYDVNGVIHKVFFGSHWCKY